MDGVLGKQVGFPQSPDDPLAQLVPIKIEPLPVDHATTTIVRLSCPEFTSLCPVTGQPDFAHFIIDYAPVMHYVETKSLKLFMGSFRNHASYHEECTRLIFAKLQRCLDPWWLRVSAFWMPRGGIPIDVVCQHGILPPNAHVLPLDIPMYKAR